MAQGEAEYSVERNVFAAVVLVVMINDKPGEIDAERLAGAPTVIAEHTKCLRRLRVPAFRIVAVVSEPEAGVCAQCRSRFHVGQNEHLN
jgi:hypothetical protein